MAELKLPCKTSFQFRSRENDNERLALFPSLDYKGLYSTLLQFLDLISIIPSGVYDFGKAFLCTLRSGKVTKSSTYKFFV